MRPINDILKPGDLPPPRVRAPYMYSLHLRGEWHPFIPADQRFEEVIQLPRHQGSYKFFNPHGLGPIQYTHIITNRGLIKAYQILFPDGRIWDSRDHAFLDLHFPSYQKDNGWWTAL